MVPLAGLTLGLVLAAPASAAEPPTTSSSSTHQQLHVDHLAPRTTSTSTSTTTSTTLAPPPATTPPVTSTLIPPLVDSGEPAEIGEAAQLQRDRRGTLPRTGPRPTATGPTLPFTGNGTLAVFAAGLAALAIGALALWWGSRNRPEVDARGPEATG